MLIWITVECLPAPTAGALILPGQATPAGGFNRGRARQAAGQCGGGASIGGSVGAALEAGALAGARLALARRPAGRNCQNVLTAGCAAAEIIDR
jgi:hypothetical protein